MPRLLNLGSLNLDLVYRVPHLVRPGETLASVDFRQGAGGKGLNQSLAAARAGLSVIHAGVVGRDGDSLRALLEDNGVDVSALRRVEDQPTGHAIILVSDAGENAIVLHGGANQAVREIDLAAALAPLGPTDWFLTQNETSCVPEAIRLAHARGLRVAFNPAPMSEAVLRYPLDAVSLLIVNETEATALAGVTEPEQALAALSARWPRTQVVVTLGKEGAATLGPRGSARARPPRVQVVDTTAAGDTFIGYLLAAVLRDEPMNSALTLACRAAALSTTRPGAAASIPTAAEVAALAPAQP